MSVAGPTASPASATCGDGVGPAGSVEPLGSRLAWRSLWRAVGAAAAVPLVWAIRAYQLLLSPLLAQQCRFYPSCSAYAVTALQRHGPIHGGWLALRRLARCHPWNPGGVDHVPATRHCGPDARAPGSLPPSPSP